MGAEWPNTGLIRNKSLSPSTLLGTPCNYRLWPVRVASAFLWCPTSLDHSDLWPLEFPPLSNSQFSFFSVPRKDRNRLFIGNQWRSWWIFIIFFFLCVLKVHFVYHNMAPPKKTYWSWDATGVERKDAGVSSGLKAKASKNKDAHTHAHKHRRAPQLSRWRRRRYRCGCKAEGKQPSAAAAYEAKQRQVEPRPPAAVLNPGILTGGSAVGCAFPASEFLPKTAFKPDHPDINTHPDCLATGSAGGRDGGGHPHAQRRLTLF